MVEQRDQHHDEIDADDNGVRRRRFNPPVGDSVMRMEDEAAVLVWTDEGGQQGAGSEASTGLAVAAPASHSAVRVSTGAPLDGGNAYAAAEGDFQAHHATNAARHRGPYTSYRLVYRYGYDLGADARYRSAEWAQVEQAARPRWEERNPGTWDQFKDTIRYAWDIARRRS